MVFTNNGITMIYSGKKSIEFHCVKKKFWTATVLYFDV